MENEWSCLGIFWTKLAILGINLLPLLMARPLPIPKRGRQLVLYGVEKAFALRAKRVGGLGVSPVYLTAIYGATSRSSSENKMSVTPSSYSQAELKKISSQQSIDAESAVYLNSYELLRLGYVVFGTAISSLLTTGSFSQQWPHCDHFIICGTNAFAFGDWKIWIMRTATDCALSRPWNQKCGGWMIQRLQIIHFWQISSCGIRC
ncbi:hypothetical protein GQ600_3991 [Phytophthora cactorum]|nr:hypothetical protein GQ600_3991 [Phytophthora cactorum]